MTNGISEDSPRSREIKRSAGSRGQSGVSAGAFVYVISADNGEVKVGSSGAPYARLSQVKREYAARRGFTSARLVGFVRTAWPMAVEAAAQHRLLAHVVGGEWFRVDPEMALQVVLEEAGEFDELARAQRPEVRQRKPAAG